METIMEETIILKTEFIKLDQALKHVLGVSGGEAKDIILFEDVLVNDEICRMRGKKLRGGDVVKFDDVTIKIQ